MKLTHDATMAASHPTRHSQACAVCGTLLAGKRPDARYCGATCRKRASRNAPTAEIGVTKPGIPISSPPPVSRLQAHPRAIDESSGSPTDPQGFAKLLKWMDKRFYIARMPDDTGWKLYLPIDKLLIELNWVLRQDEKRGNKPCLPPQTAASLTALLLEAEVDPDFPSRLPLGGPAERRLDPMERSKSTLSWGTLKGFRSCESQTPR